MDITNKSRFFSAKSAIFIAILFLLLAGNLHITNAQITIPTTTTITILSTTSITILSTTSTSSTTASTTTAVYNSLPQSINIAGAQVSPVTYTNFGSSNNIFPNVTEPLIDFGLVNTNYTTKTANVLTFQGNSTRTALYNLMPFTFAVSNNAPANDANVVELVTNSMPFWVSGTFPLYVTITGYPTKTSTAQVSQLVSFTSNGVQKVSLSTGLYNVTAITIFRYTFIQDLQIIVANSLVVTSQNTIATLASLNRPAFLVRLSSGYKLYTNGTSLTSPSFTYNPLPSDLISNVPVQISLFQSPNASTSKAGQQSFFRLNFGGHYIQLCNTTDPAQPTPIGFPFVSGCAAIAPTFNSQTNTANNVFLAPGASFNAIYASANTLINATSSTPVTANFVISNITNTVKLTNTKAIVALNVNVIKTSNVPITLTAVISYPCTTKVAAGNIVLQTYNNGNWMPVNGVINSTSCTDTFTTTVDLILGLFLKLQPLNVSVAPSTVLDLGQSRVLTATASGGLPPYSYQWYNDTSGANVAIQGANSNTLTLNTTTGNPQFRANTGGDLTYSVVVRDNQTIQQQALSNTAKVHINPPLFITTITQYSRAISVGQTLTFRSHILGGTPSYNYQWYTFVSGVPTPISGANSSTLAINFSTAGRYTYYLKARDNATTPMDVTSDIANITVN